MLTETRVGGINQGSVSKAVLNQRRRRGSQARVGTANQATRRGSVGAPASFLNKAEPRRRNKPPAGASSVSSDNSDGRSW